MKAKWLNIGLILTSLLGNLEWGEHQVQFVFEIIGLLFYKLFSDPFSVMHPLVIFPLLGELLLLGSLFQKSPGKKITFLGMGLIGFFMVILFIVGIMAGNLKIVSSILPFLMLGWLTIRFHRTRHYIP